MIAINEKKISERFKDFEDVIKSIDDKALKNLKRHIERYELSDVQKEWLNSFTGFLENNNTRLVDISFELLNNLIQQIGTIQEGDKIVQREIEASGKSIDKKFKDLIIDALDYEGLKNKLFKDYFSKIDIKTCVYCNSQFTITIEKTSNLFQPRFQFDHILPQSEYPHLSISILNLAPTCSTCNLLKSSKELNFKPYFKDNHGYDYRFEIDKASIFSYLSTLEQKNIKFNFIDSDYLTASSEKSLEEKLSISKIYNEHKDIAEEIIWKAIVYNHSYVSDLNSFISSQLETGNLTFERFFIGNYFDENDLLKRPMAKFTKDIFNEIQLLKNDIDKVIK